VGEKVDQLHLRAHDLEDLSIISSMVQDALIPAGDMAYLPDSRQFVMALNRFQWEKAGATPPYHRTHAGLRFDNITMVQRLNIKASERDRLLCLLSITYDDQTVMLTFSEDVAIRLGSHGVAVALDDLGEPWPTRWKPEHQPV
jgi:hypothetical protein